MKLKTIRLSIVTFFLLIMLMSISTVASVYFWTIKYFDLHLTAAATGYGLPTAIATLSIGLIAIQIQNETKEIAKKKLILDCVIEYEKIHTTLQNLVEKLADDLEDLKGYKTTSSLPLLKTLGKSSVNLSDDMLFIGATKKIMYIYSTISSAAIPDTEVLLCAKRIDKLCTRINNKYDSHRYEVEKEQNIKKLMQEIVNFKSLIENLYQNFFNYVNQ